jgi:hypothetical protein
MFYRTLCNLNKEMLPESQTQLTNFRTLIKAMTPVKFEESSTEEEETDGDPSIMDLLSCFHEVSCNGLKVCFEQHKVDFLPSLSAISLMRRRASHVDEF